MKALTPAEGRKAIRWFQRVMGLGDWRIELSLARGPPDWCAGADDGRLLGHCLPQPAFKRAQVWVANSRCLEANEWEPLEVLFHELLHVDCDDVGIDGHMRSHGEYMLDRLATILAWAYRHGMKP